MILELADQKKGLGEPITAATIAVATFIINNWDKIPWDKINVRDLFDPKGAEKRRLQDLFSMAVRDGWASDQGRAGTGINAASGMNCAELAALSGRVQWLINYWSDAANFRAGTAERVVKRYQGLGQLMAALVAEFQARKNCVNLNLTPDGGGAENAGGADQFAPPATAQPQQNDFSKIALPAAALFLLSNL